MAFRTGRGKIGEYKYGACCPYTESLCSHIEQMDLFTDREKEYLMRFFIGHRFTRLINYRNAEYEYDYEKQIIDLQKKINPFKTDNKRKFFIDKIIEDVIQDSEGSTSDEFLFEFESEVKPKLLELISAPKQYNSFAEIFNGTDWKKYVNALCEIEPKLLKILDNGKYKFIGNPNKDKGVICSWIKELQNKGKINRNIKRQKLSLVLNTEIEGINIGKDGKTFDNMSGTYRKDYQNKLLKDTGLLP